MERRARLGDTWRLHLFFRWPLALLAALGLAWTSWAWAETAAQLERIYRLGVFAWRPAEILLPRYQPLADTLSTALPGAKLELVVLDQTALEHEIAAGRIDFLLTNPSHYLLLMHRGYFSAPLATMVNREGEASTSQLGGVILVAAEREDIRTLADLRGQRIAIPGVKFLGGYQTQAYELLQVGIRLPNDAQVIEVGSHDKVIETLLAGAADVGFVRTGVLEAWAREGRTDVRRLRVLNRQEFENFPFVTSTRLYPEWAFAAMPQVPEHVLRRMVRALLMLEADHPAMQAAGIAGFTIPANYAPVEQLARALRLPPFEHADFAWHDVWQRYRAWIAVVAGLTLLAVMLAALLYRERARLLVEHDRLADALEENRAILDALGEGVYGIDQHGRCVFVNARAVELLGFERAVLIGADAHHLFHRAAHDSATAHEACRLHQPLRDGQPLKTDDVFLQADGSHLPVHVNVQPIRREGAVVGAVVAFHDIRERQRLIDELTMMASHDALTGLFNRREFLRRLNEELARLKRQDGQASLLMLDLDRFKQINDVHGHLAGDQVLKAFAGVCKAQLRGQDVVGRLGGEEFACLLPQTGVDEARSVAERLRAEFAALPIKVCDQQILHATTSIGLTACQLEDSAERVLARADEALYRAKNAGRNCVVVAP